MFGLNNLFNLNKQDSGLDQINQILNPIDITGNQTQLRNQLKQEGMNIAKKALLSYVFGPAGAAIPIDSIMPNSSQGGLPGLKTQLFNNEKSKNDNLLNQLVNTDNQQEYSRYYSDYLNQRKLLSQLAKYL